MSLSPARIAATPRGKTHWNWNEAPNRLVLHRRLHRKYGKASAHKCVDCPRQAHDWSNETGRYTDRIEDYKPRCRSCHVKLDKNWKRKDGRVTLADRARAAGVNYQTVKSRVRMGWPEERLFIKPRQA